QIHSMKNPKLQKLSAGIILLFFVSVNIYFPPRKAKLDIRSVVKEVNAMTGPNDFIYVKNPLIFFETVYYSKDRNKVFLYNPDRSPFPWYVGESAFSQSQMAYELPVYPQRAFMIDIDRSVAIHYTTTISSQRTMYE
ncbi:MAG: hypothetical protein N3A54_07295, partial [Patescibacteria group bacterium]|nr:hypothetical protein [Patescibacteria group bacterium]